MAADPLGPSQGGLADYVDIQTGLPEGDLRSIPTTSERLQQSAQAPAVTLPREAGEYSRPTQGVWVPPIGTSAPRSSVASPIVTRETQSRVRLAPSAAEVRDAVASPAPAAANIDGQAALMSVLFDRAQLLDPMTPRLGGETVSGVAPGRLVPSPISIGRIPALRAAPEGPRASASTPSQAPSPAPRKPDMTVGQLARGLGGALGSMAVDAAGAAAVSVWYAPKVDFQGYRAILARKDFGPVRKTAYSVLLPVSTLLAVGLAPFLGGLWGLGRGWLEGKDRGFRFAIQGARDDVRMFRKNASRLELLAKELADDVSRSLGLREAGSKGAAAIGAAPTARSFPTVAGTVAAASVLALLLAAVLFVIARLLLAI
jgi:hypothetical protein